jgi:hypothetical protein
LACTTPPACAPRPRDGELWNLRITSVPEPHETEQYIRSALEMGNAAFAVVDVPAAP